MKDLDFNYPLTVAISPDGCWAAWIDQLPDWEANAYLRRIVVGSLSELQSPRVIIEGWSSISTLLWLDQGLCWHGIHKGRSVLATYEMESGRMHERPLEGCHINAIAWSGANKQLMLIGTRPHSEEKEGCRSAHFVIEDAAVRMTYLACADEPSRPVLCLPEVFNADHLSFRASEGVFTGVPSCNKRDQRRYLYHYDGRAVSVLLGGDSAVFSPVWHQSRRCVAYLRRRGAWNDLEGANLCSLDMETGEERLLCEGLEYFSQVILYDDSQVLLQTQTHSRTLGLHAVDPKRGILQPVALDTVEIAYGFQLAADQNRFCCVGLSKRSGPEVLFGELNTRQHRKLSSYSISLELTEIESKEWIGWSSVDGEKVEGLLLVGKKVTALLAILHGGPVSSYFDVGFLPFLDRWTPYPIAELLSSGFVLFLPNYRGSAGRGAAFRMAIKGKVGQMECEDTLTGIDAVENYLKMTLLVGVAGWSHGGYLAALLATKYGSRFAAASAGAAITDLKLHRWTSGNNMESYFTDKADVSLSPVDFVQSGGPPILIQHGSRDSVISPLQSKMLYRKLQSADVNAELIAYPGEHVISTPKEMYAIRKHNLDWFSKHCISAKNIKN